MRGHTQSQCRFEIDRSDRCYRCGVSGHRAGSCAHAPRCPLCVDLGGPADHAWGSSACASPEVASHASGFCTLKSLAEPPVSKVGSTFSPIIRGAGTDGAGGSADNVILFPPADSALTTVGTKFYDKYG